MKVGLSRLIGEDFDILFDEHGNVFSLRGEYAGTYTGELENYFKEYEKNKWSEVEIELYTSIYKINMNPKHDVLVVIWLEATIGLSTCK